MNKQHTIDVVKIVFFAAFLVVVITMGFFVFKEAAENNYWGR